MNDFGTCLRFGESTNRRLPLKAFVVILSLAWPFAHEARAREGVQGIGLSQSQRVLPLTGTDIDGQPIAVDYNSHRYTLLSFFFSECIGCIQEIPALNRFAASHPDVEVVGVTFDGVADAASFAQKYGIRFQVVTGAQHFIDQLQVTMYPTLALINRKGEFVAASRAAAGIDQSGKSVDLVEHWFKQQSSTK